MNIKNKNVLIIGPPASGKTTLANELQKVNKHCLVHTDDYMVYPYEEALYIMMEDMKKLTYPTIIEGVQGYRLLRKGVQLGTYFPDLVIEMEVTREQQAAIYESERDPAKLKYLKGFAAAHQKILNDYFELIGDRKPEWIKVNIHQPRPNFKKGGIETGDGEYKL